MDVTFSEDELFFLLSHTPQGEIYVGEDYGWFDIPTGLSIDCPNEGLRHGLELEDNERGHADRPQNRDGTAPSGPLATDSPCWPSIAPADNYTGLGPSLVSANSPNGFPTEVNCPNRPSCICPSNNPSKNPS
ncbi:hypothetical protein FF1_012033 [Malus domestica]